MDQTFMKEKNILPLVLSMSLPMVISMAVNSLYNIVDSYFVAKLSEEAMTALALVYPIQNLVTSIGVGFGIGINALISFYLGAQEKNNAHKATTIGMGLSVIHGIVLTILCLLGMPGFLRMFSSNEYTISLALQYSDVVFTFAIVSVIGISFEKVFQAVGRMKVSMFSMICGFVTNIVLDPLMIFGIGPFPTMGIRGAAIATVLGQFVSLAVYIIIYFVTPNPKAKQNAIIITQEIKKLTKPLKTCEISRISLGKYTFLIIPAFDLIDVVPALTVVKKKVHGINPVIK